MKVLYKPDVKEYDKYTYLKKQLSLFSTFIIFFLIIKCYILIRIEIKATEVVCRVLVLSEAVCIQFTLMTLEIYKSMIMTRY